MAETDSTTRHPNFKDLTGQVFGRLTVIREAGCNNQGKVMWACRCECGGERTVRGSDLRRARTLSCGCLRRETTVATHTTHGLAHSAEYATWSHMVNRCCNPNDSQYHDYGGRGITICTPWLNSFSAFYDDMGPRPSPDYSIDRIDNNLGYCKENCRWATRKEQNRNSRQNRLLEFDGKIMCVTEWSAETGISSSALRHRLDAGWPVKRILTTPVKHATSPPHPE